jgi:hypothetical protein
MARRLCDAILNGLLLHEESDNAEAANKLALSVDADATAGGNGGGISAFPRTVRYALGIHVFCATSEHLCVTDDNPMVGGCTSRIQLTHSSKAPGGFNP